MAVKLACARRFEGFMGLVRKDGKYGAKYQAEHIKAARTALDPGRFSSENLSLVPTSSWAIGGFPSCTDREQVRSLLQAWGWTTIPSHVTRSTWIVRGDSSPPATRCYQLWSFAGSFLGSRFGYLACHPLLPVLLWCRLLFPLLFRL